MTQDNVSDAWCMFIRSLNQCTSLPYNSAKTSCEQLHLSPTRLWCGNILIPRCSSESQALGSNQSAIDVESGLRNCVAAIPGGLQHILCSPASFFFTSTVPRSCVLICCINLSATLPYSGRMQQAGGGMQRAAPLAQFHVGAIQPASLRTM